MVDVLLATCTGAMYVCDYKNNLNSTDILNRKKTFEREVVQICGGG